MGTQCAIIGVMIRKNDKMTERLPMLSDMMPYILGTAFLLWAYRKKDVLNGLLRMFNRGCFGFDIEVIDSKIEIGD